MYKVITYKDRTGKDEISDYNQELNRKMTPNKDAKTPPQEIRQAERNLRDFLERYGE